MADSIYDVIIIGGGPGGYTAALYCVRSGLSALVIEKLSAGGQMAETEQVDNYPGAGEGVGGFELAERMREGAEHFGAQTLYAQAQKADLRANPKRITTDQGERLGRSVVLAMGAYPRMLGLDGEQELRGKGIHISDRKYFNYAPIAQAKAWLSGRDTVEPSDLTTLCAYLWTAPEERTIIQSTLERMCNDPLKDRLDTILAEAVEGYQEFTDTADAPAARRIGKLRDEFMSLYITLSQMLSNAQSDAEREKINACLEELERYSKEAHASVQYSYVPLRELYDLKAS